MSTLTHAPDLTQHPPRSPRVRLGGYVILPRMLDKGRASLNGKSGDYHYACPMDQRFLDFAGIDAEKLKEQLAAGAGEEEILDWITANAANKPSDWEIATWSAFQLQRTPGDVESKEYFIGLQSGISKTREDLLTWFDILDWDDFVSYGGKP
ncbi:MAG: DUF5069 domain-containing protein [Verrucomicrobium sp.]